MPEQTLGVHDDRSAPGRSFRRAALLTVVGTVLPGVGLIAEQAWEAPDLAASPFGTPPGEASIGFENGKPAGSASALTWSAGQFVRLMLDTAAGRVLDRPRYTTRRYVRNTQGHTALTVTAPTDRTIVNSPVTLTGTSTPGNTIRIAATNVDLKAAISAGTFRQDLFYRLNVLRLHLPPLRERGDDVLLLAHHFIQKHAALANKPAPRLSHEAAMLMQQYAWPGNVRELEHAIERAVIVARGSSIRLRDLPPEVSQKSRQRGPGDSLDLQALERAAIERALERFRGNRREAADALRISTVTLWRKMKQYGLVA